jgi:hypothetical protein
MTQRFNGQLEDYDQVKIGFVIDILKLTKKENIVLFENSK